jgi:hypothetical protein
MQDKAANHFDAIANKLHRNPVLTALLVISLIMGVTASIAGVAAWRASSACIAETSALPRVVKVVVDDARNDLLVHQALQDALACPCAASIWHWQRI